MINFLGLTDDNSGNSSNSVVGDGDKSSDEGSTYQSIWKEVRR
jgi:hypothetical protein